MHTAFPMGGGTRVFRVVACCNFTARPDILRSPMTPGVTVLAFYDRISLYHSLAPWILGLHRDVWAQMVASPPKPPRITYTDDPQWCLTCDTNEVLIMVRMFLKPPVTDSAMMARLRGRYRRIFFLNGNAGGGLHRPEVLSYVDRFYNKAVFADRQLYTQPLYGGELFTDDNHRRLGIVDPTPVIPQAVTHEELSKIHLHWNIGVGDFPRRRFLQRVGVAAARSPIGAPPWTAPIFHRREMLQPAPLPSVREDEHRFEVNARLGSPGYPTIAAHRRDARRGAGRCGGPQRLAGGP